jgi:hypothetical protein
MRKKILLILFCACAGVSAQAQNIIRSLERAVPGQGRVTIHQDARVTALLGGERTTYTSGSDRTVLKVEGFRIQAYAGNNTRQAKSEAGNTAARIKERFPDQSVYTTFNPPRWICRVGDYRSIEEADAMMRKLKATGVFKEVSIVKDKINIRL